MSESIDYAEMLEIPVNTLNVTKKRAKRKASQELKEQAVESVNERVLADSEEGCAEGENITDYGQPRVEEEPELLPVRKKFLESKLLVVEFVAVCALCAAILLTNFLWENSAMNTFFRGLTAPTPAVKQDERVYSELTLSSVVPDAEIECTVGETGVLTFTGKCSVYSPYGGTVAKAVQSEQGATVEIQHTSSFKTVISGLQNAFVSEGERVFATLPIGRTDGSAPVSVSMYDNGTLIRSYTVNEQNSIIWNV